MIYISVSLIPLLFHESFFCVCISVVNIIINYVVQWCYLFLDISKVAAKRKNDIESVDAEIFTDDEADEAEVKQRIRKPKVVKF